MKIFAILSNRFKNFPPRHLNVIGLPPSLFVQSDIPLNTGRVSDQPTCSIWLAGCYPPTGRRKNKKQNSHHTLLLCAIPHSRIAIRESSHVLETIPTQSKERRKHSFCQVAEFSSSLRCTHCQPFGLVCWEYLKAMKRNRLSISSVDWTSLLSPQKDDCQQSWGTVANVTIFWSFQHVSTP